MSSNVTRMAAKETIQEWLNNAGRLPEESDKFFNMWVLLNAYYNEKYTEREELKRVLHFGRDFEFIFVSLDGEILKGFIVPECIGNGKLTEPPDEYVKNASEFLKNILRVTYNCERCRDNKKIRCNQNVIAANYGFQNFEALIRILYQIRCNLFHGDKLDDEECQQLRNDEIITKGNNILRTVLEEIAR